MPLGCNIGGLRCCEKLREAAGLPYEGHGAAEWASCGSVWLAARWLPT